MNDISQADHQRLQELLAAGQLKEADQETADTMCRLSGRIREGWLRTEDLDLVPASALQEMDLIWSQNSDGHFGFAVQKKIYEGLGGGQQYDQEIWESFGDVVGWRNKQGWLSYADLKFSADAPQGCFPSSWCASIGTWVPLCYFLSSKFR